MRDTTFLMRPPCMMYSSDIRATAKQLWKPHIGVLEIRILGATGLMPVKVKQGKGGTTDAYCVAKYGQKWIRTRTVVKSLSPEWNEQYTGEVFDPCTVITIGVFDKNINGNAGARDSRIGKVRIRLSTLESDRVYTHSYPLLMLHSSGVKKMGELHLAVRFSCANMGNMLHMAEPPLGQEVVEFMLDHDSHIWSMRRSKANFFRLMNVISGVVSMSRWDWRYRFRHRHPPHMDTRLSHAESVYPDELDEEFDSFPTSRSADIVRMRYDRLRSVAGRIQTVVGDMATQGERFQALLNWRDPRATFLYVIFCLFAAVGFYVVPFRLVVALWALYALRPPRFRSK
ncbi:hypothetical protein PTKIN_Ptkin12aG0095400 [Pterospermum kingtungense]